jgi:CheY-like chemotaxis protein/anti-sigma regulatory factor (Ser/Thr protein kinase)
VALRDLLGPVVLEAEVVCHSKGLQFDSVIDDVAVDTDPSLMRRAIANLLSNAARYTPAGDVRLTARVEGLDVVLTITDTGIGIAPEDQQRVFEEFVQLANPARDRDRGVGLGLSIVRRICTLLHLELHMASKPRVGTTFTLRFPVASLPAQETSMQVQATADAPTLEGRRVWIVEDDLLVRDALARQFGAWGSHCSFASGADEIRALREAEGSWPDVILMDDMLGSPEGGLEIANWLREQMPSERILLVTGNVGQRLQALEESGLAVFRKPLSSTDLARGVRSAMASIGR